MHFVFYPFIFQIYRQKDSLTDWRTRKVHTNVSRTRMAKEII